MITALNAFAIPLLNTILLLSSGVSHKCELSDFCVLMSTILPFSAARVHSHKRIGPHNYNILSILIGSLLGDGHMEKYGDGSRFVFYQAKINGEYLLWLHSKFASQGYCNPVVPKIITRLSKGGKIRNIIRFHTFTYSSFNYIQEDWYLNGIKFVPQNIDTYLTPLALAVWIMDDGSRSGSGLKLSTNSFTFEDTTRLVLNLNKLYGIKSSVQNAGHLNQYIIYI